MAACSFDAIRSSVRSRPAVGRSGTARTTAAPGPQASLRVRSFGPATFTSPRPSKALASARRHASSTFASSSNPTTDSPSTDASSTSGLREELLGLLGEGTLESLGSRKSRVEVNKRVEELVAALQTQSPAERPSEDPALPGRWRLLATFKPGEASADFFSLQSWQEYFFNKGPSPVQSLVVGNTRTVSRVYQILQFEPENRFLNVVDFSGDGGVLVLEAPIIAFDGPTNIQFRFGNGFFIVNKLPFGPKLDPPIKVPYPVPFELLGERANGSLNTTFLEGDLRISVGNKGTVFVLKREEEGDSMDLSKWC